MLSVHNIALERYFEPVFRPVSFSVSAGNMLLVTGPNGCGKTTLLRILAGILQPSQGEINCAVTGKVYVGHQLAVKDDLSVTENIAFMQDFNGHTGAAPLAIAQQLGLQRVASQSARTLSAGQKKRCALARLLLSDEKLWLLDEPYANLDRDGMIMLDGMLRDHLDAGGACVLTAHGSLKPRDLEMQECKLESGSERGSDCGPGTV